MDLWTQAAARLRNKDRDILDLGTTVNLPDLLSSVRDGKDECRRKQWVVNNVVLRDVFSKIAVWIQRFTDVGDVAIQYDPGHAALPWAAVRFILRASVQDIQRYSIVIEGIEKVMNIITRYRVVEGLCLATGTQSTDPLKDHLIELYTQVLVFLAKAKRFYAKNTATRAFQSITDVGNKFQVQLERLGKQEQEVRMSKEFVDTQCLKDLEGGIAALSLKEGSDHQRLVNLLQDLERPINRMEKELENAHDSLNAQERTRILRWVSSNPYIQHHTQAQKDILAGTGQWFLNNECVLGWQTSSSSSILWLHGPPGSGKSKLVAILIERYLSEFRHGRNPNPVYFYCTRNPAEPDRGSPEGVLRSLVKQLSCLEPGEAVLDPIRTVYEAREKNDFAAGSLSEEECTNLIIELCQYRPLTTIIIDALDECEPRRRYELFDAISTILQKSKNLVKVLIASRDDRDITIFLEGRLNLEIDVSKSSGDIGLFVTKEVDRLVKSKRLLAGEVPPDLCANIKSTLLNEAHGMFRWVSLQLQYLCGLKLEAVVRKRLGKLPPDLRELYSQTYAQMLDTYVDEQRYITENVFHLLMCLVEQLDTYNFIRAVSSYQQEKVELSKRNILDLCGNFVVIDTELNVFRFAHLSVREFFESERGYNVEQNHTSAARCCMNYLSRMSNIDTRCAENDPDDLEALSNNMTDGGVVVGNDDTPVIIAPRSATFITRLVALLNNGLKDFHDYACYYWPHHVFESTDCQTSLQFREMYGNFIVGENGDISRSFVYWNAFTCPYLFVACLGTRGFCDRRQRNHDRMLRCTVSDQADCLFYASAWGFEDIIRIRMQSDPIASESGTLSAYTRALHIACHFGNSREAKLLLEAGVRLNEQMMYGLYFMREVPYVKSDFACESRGLSASSWEQGLIYPLHACAAENSVSMLQLLLAHRPDTEVFDYFHDTPLHLAAANGHVTAVSLLLAHDVGMAKSTKDFWTVATRLQNAAQTGSEGLLSQLLADWPKGDQETLYLGRILWNAVDRNESPCTEILLSKGASVHSVFRGQSLLEKALRIHVIKIYDKEEHPPAEPTILEKLVAYGADVNQLIDGEPALGFAIWHCTNDAVRVLLDAGADIDAEDGEPLRTAIAYNFLSVVRLLLERGANPNAKPPGIPSGLQVAKEYCGPEIAELLIQYGAEDLEEGYADVVDSKMTGLKEQVRLTRVWNQALREIEEIFPPLT